jgi:hypothetical protein
VVLAIAEPAVAIEVAAKVKANAPSIFVLLVIKIFLPFFAEVIRLK